MTPANWLPLESWLALAIPLVLVVVVPWLLRVWVSHLRKRSQREAHARLDREVSSERSGPGNGSR